MNTNSNKPRSVQQHFSWVCSQAPPPENAYPVANGERRALPRFPCDYPAKIFSPDLKLVVGARMLDYSAGGTKVKADFPQDGPKEVILHDLANHELYECEVRWRSGEFLGLRFVDILGPTRRRKFLEGASVPIMRAAAKGAGGAT